MHEEIFEVIKKYLSEVKLINLDAINKQASLIDDLSLKSVDIAQLATYLECEFDVDMPYMKFIKKKTIGEVIEFIEKSM